VNGKTEAGTPIIRNPATRPVMEFLDNALVLARLVTRHCCCVFLTATKPMCFCPFVLLSVS